VNDGAYVPFHQTFVNVEAKSWSDVKGRYR
jgi:hypothetical protein